MAIRSNDRINQIRVESLEAMILMSASVEGTDASEWLSAGSPDDVISAGAGDDEIHAPFGASYIDGGNGIDTFVIYQGARNDFDVRLQLDGSVIVEGKGLNGIDAYSKLVNVERISFTDRIILTSELEVTEVAPLPAVDPPVAVEQPSIVDPPVIAEGPQVLGPPLQLALTANADTFVIGNNRFLKGDVLSNDFDSTGSVLTTSVSKSPSHGLLLMGTNGQFGYLKTSTNAETDYFEYSVTNQRGEISTARVDILKSAPGVSSVALPASQLSAIAVEVADALPSVAPPVVAELPNSESPPASPLLPETQVALPAATLAQSVVSENGNPFAGDDSFDSVAGQTLFGNVSTNDGDTDDPNYELKFELVENVDYGSLNFYEDGSFDYVADKTSTPLDTFRYRVKDLDGGVAFADVKITRPVTSPPSVSTPAQRPAIAASEPLPPSSPVPPSPPVAEFSPVVVGDPVYADDLVVATGNGSTAGNLLTARAEVGGELLQIIEHTAARFGTVTVDQQGQFSYQADTGFSGIDYFHYLVGDNDKNDWATVVLHVNTDGQLPTGYNNFITVTPGVATPIVFDLNKDNIISVTGETTAKDKSGITSVGRTVRFDIDADGTLDSIEWITGSGDGILVDTSKFQGTSIDGAALFGDEGGKYENGFVKLAALDTNGDSFLQLDELNSLKLWVDDGDGILQINELETLQKHDIFSISTRMNLTDAGLMQSSAFTTNDLRILTEDVWFARSPVAETPVADGDNQKPDADPDILTGKRNESITGNVLANDRDLDGDTLTVLKHTRPVHGLLTIDNDGAFTYTPDQNFVGVDYFQYEVSDGKGGSDTAVVMLNVLADTAVISEPTGHTIKGTIWADSNRNGIQDAIETVRGNRVFVSLLNEQGTVLQSVNSDVNGQYSFGNLQNGSYRVRVSASSLPAIGGIDAVLTLRDVNSNFFDAVDSDVSSSTGLSSLISLGAGETGFRTTTIDAGFVYA